MDEQSNGPGIATVKRFAPRMLTGIVFGAAAV
jgi:hypothetical protein